MARWEVTLAQPGGTTDALPPVVLNKFGEDGYKRSTKLANVLSDRTIGGAGILEGTTVPFYHEWELSVLDFEDTVLELEALIAWQDAEAGRVLYLTDEVEYTLPRFGTHPKILLGGSIITVATGCTTGFPIVPVLIALPDQHKQHSGVKGDVNGKRISIIAVEVN